MENLLWSFLGFLVALVLGLAVLQLLGRRGVNPVGAIVNAVSPSPATAAAA